VVVDELAAVGVEQAWSWMSISRAARSVSQPSMEDGPKSL
jgi:hypothetical protein